MSKGVNKYRETYQLYVELVLTGRLTDDKEKQVVEVYQRLLSFSKTARETGVNEKTVKRIVVESKNTQAKGSGTGEARSSPPGESELSVDQRKAVYEKLDQGANPVDIIKETGFPSGLVEKEFKAYCRLKVPPELEQLSKKILELSCKPNT